MLRGIQGHQQRLSAVIPVVVVRMLDDPVAQLRVLGGQEDLDGAADLPEIESVNLSDIVNVQKLSDVTGAKRGLPDVPL